MSVDGSTLEEETGAASVAAEEVHEDAASSTGVADGQRVAGAAQRFPLAYDAVGNPIRLPSSAIRWRVRRAGAGRGRPRNVFDSGTGRQLEIELTATIEDLAATNVPAGRYLLYPIDDQGTILAGLVAVTEVPAGEFDEEQEEADDDRDGLRHDSRDSLVGLIARQQSTIEEAMRSHVAQGAQLVAALGSALGGYAPVRPAQLPPPMAPPAPVVVSAPMAPPPPPPEGLLAQLSKLQPDQVQMWAMIARQAWDYIKSAIPPDMAAAAAGGGVGAGGP